MLDLHSSDFVVGAVARLNEVAVRPAVLVKVGPPGSRKKPRAEPVWRLGATVPGFGQEALEVNKSGINKAAGMTSDLVVVVVAAVVDGDACEC